MLLGFDPDLVGWLMEKFDELGIDVRLRSLMRVPRWQETRSREPAKMQNFMHIV